MKSIKSKSLKSKSLKSDLSPLRWVGGKSRAVSPFSQLIPYRPEVVAPFFGGGSYELALAESGVIVHGYDADPWLVAFWQMALSKPALLAAIADTYHPMNKEKFLALRKDALAGKLSKEHYAVALFVVNRCARSGNVYNGGYNNPRDRKSVV